MRNPIYGVVAHAARIVAVLGIASVLLAQPARGQTDDRAVHTDRFVLNNHARVTLHHFLIAWATADAGAWPPWATPITEREDWTTGLDAAGQAEWSAAVAAYAATVGRSHVFDGGLIALRALAAGTGSQADVAPDDRGVARALEAVLPLYRRHWWPEHRERNQRWIEAVAIELDDTEEEIVAGLEAAYGGSWPESRIPVDVVVYANPLSAYSTMGRLTLSSRDRDLRMPYALEMVFHEASHVDEVEGPLRGALRRAFEGAGAEEPDRFWHDMIFFTSGDLTRLALERRGQAGYEHYGSLGVYVRGERWRTNLPALEAHWRPFLETGSSEREAREDALLRVARQVGGNGGR